MKYVLIVICLLSAPHIVEAVDRYATISAAGCGVSSSTYTPASNTCGAGTARVHVGVGAVQAAANEQAPGDRILVRGLTSTIYTGQVIEGVNSIQAKSGTAGGCGTTSSFPPTSLGTSTCSTIEGYQNERPILMGVSNASYIYLKNVIIGGPAPFPTVNSSGLSSLFFSRIENVEIRNTPNMGIIFVGNSEFINLDLHDNGFDDATCIPTGGRCHGVYTGTGSGQGWNIFDGGRYYRNAGYGIHCYNSCYGTIVRNTRLDHNGNVGLILACGASCDQPSVPNLVYNTVIDNNPGGGMILQMTGNQAYNVTLFSNGGNDVTVALSATVRNVISPTAMLVQGGTLTQSNNITNATSAHFADVGSGDFRLCQGKGIPTASCAAASSAIGAGIQLNSTFTTDINGATRGTVWDIGAYESSTVATPTVVVTSPTISGTYSASSSPLSVSGTFQSGAPLTSVTWSNSLGGSGTATGTSNWTIPAVSLTTGTNVITITGTDANSLTGQATLTVTYAPGSLVGAWSCDEGAGATVNDASGNSNTGTFTSAAWSGSGKFGAACSFNGSTGIVTVADANSLDLVGGATLQAWVYPTVQTSAWRSLFSKGENYYLFSSSDQQCGTSNLYGGFINGSTYNVTCNSTPLPINTWTFVTLRMDGTSVNLYTGTTTTDLALRSSLSTTQAMVTNAVALSIGNTASDPFAGLMDNMRIYNYPRSAVAGSGACGLGYSELQCDMITAINPGASVVLQLGTGTIALQLGPDVTLELGAQ